MTLPLMPAAAGRRNGWRFAGAAVLVLLALGVTGRPGGAQESEAFSATVTVDATGETAAKARDKARTDGQRRALAVIVERLSGTGAPAKLPKLDDNAITDLVASFEVANERMSAVRYVADYTFHFRPSDIRRIAGAAAASGPEQAGKEPGKEQPGKEQPGRPMILIPVYQSGVQSRLWDDPNPWRDSWERQPAAAGAARIVVPLGDAGDIAAIDADKARAGDVEALAGVARRNGGEEAVVAVAAIRGPPERPAGLDVTLRRYRAGRLVDSRSTALTANPGDSASDLLGRAVASIVSDIGSFWKKEPAPRYDQEGSLTAVLPIASLDDWLRARERLGAVPTIRKLALVAMSRQEATIEIGYVGNIDQLKSGLAQISLDLVRDDSLWRLARTGRGPGPGPGRTP